MNIDDVKDADIETPPVGRIMSAIYEHQHALAVRYGPIERRNGFYCPEVDSRPSIDDPQYQSYLKGMFWRATEEICEALETFPDIAGGWKTRWETDADLRHFFEELADALHFLTEASILVGFPSARVEQMWADDRRFRNTVLIDESTVRLRCFNIIFEMGLAANTLKNKPWKSTHMQTDQAKFDIRLAGAWLNFIKLWSSLGCSEGDVYRLYMKKMRVNQFRQESNY